MNEPKPAAFWAKIELLGHKVLAGRVSEVEMFGAKMGRLDIPTPDGGFTTQFFGGSSVYRITPVAEDVARDLARQTTHAPVMPWEYPKDTPAKALAAATIEEPEEESDEDFDDPPEF